MSDVSTSTEDPRGSLPAGGGQAMIARSHIRQTVRSLLSRLEQDAGRRREEYFKPDRTSLDAYEGSLDGYRDDLKALLSWPLNLKSFGRPQPEIVEMGQSKDATRQLIRFLGPGGTEVMGLFYRNHGDDPSPLVILLHAGNGSPEQVIADHATYHQTHRRFIERGCSVFIPQLLAWGAADGEPAIKRQALDSALKRYGSSLLAVEVANVLSVSELLTSRGWIDGERIALCGLAYGGAVALLAGAVDPRFAAVSISGYLSAMASNLLPEANWGGFSYFFSDLELAGLVCPRPLFIEVGKHDPVINNRLSRSEADSIMALFKSIGAPDQVCYHVHEGSHEMYPDDTGPNLIASCLNDDEEMA